MAQRGSGRAGIQTQDKLRINSCIKTLAWLVGWAHTSLLFMPDSKCWLAVFCWHGHMLLAIDMFQLGEGAVRITSLLKWGFGLKAAEAFVFRRCSFLCFEDFPGDSPLPHWFSFNICSVYFSTLGSPESPTLCPLTHLPHSGPVGTRTFGPGLQLQQERFWLNPRAHFQTISGCRRVHVE